MMHLNSLFGHWYTWALLMGAWVEIGALAALAFGVIARVGKGEDEGK